MTRLAVRPLLLRLHRWAGLAAAGLWLVQALTGMVMVFHWELEDLTVPGVHRATDLDAIDRRLSILAPPGSDRRVISVWTTAGAADRYDVTVARPGEREVVRISGDGAVLRVRDKRERGLFGTLVLLHQTLLAGAAGGWIIAASGALLLSNLVLGVMVAWPRKGAWRRAVAPPGRGPLTARIFGWHRALGLWLSAPAAILVLAGATLVFEDGLRNWAHAQPPKIPAIPATRTPVSVAAAARAAEAAVPGSRLTMIETPKAGEAAYRIRLLAPGELRRAYGMTTVFVDANTGRICALFPAASAPVARQFVDALYAVHTGEAEGLPGRLLNLTLAVWLATMVILGVTLWLRRRRRRVTD